MVSKIHNFVLFYCILLRMKNVSSEISHECPLGVLTTVKLDQMVKEIVSELARGKAKGEAGKIGIIGGSIEYTGAPYFSAISALKIGADVVYVVTTEEAAPVIKSYSPDLIVYPYLNVKSAFKISSLLPKMDIVVIGPGLGREDVTMTLIEDIIKNCKALEKPLVIDADGLFAISKSPTIIRDYPKPGVIMTPNHREAIKLQQAVGRNDSGWFSYFGDHVSVLVKGQTDKLLSSVSSYEWSSSSGGTGRRAAGQGDILAGSLSTVFGWALKSNNYCDDDLREQLAASIATYAIAKFTRTCNSMAFELYGRSMTASDMIGQIHKAYEDIFE